MEHWEFLIQREGDRAWRPIKTGNLQLMEGRYRIVANSNLLDTRIQTRVTHQTLGETVPQRRSQSRTQTTNPRGLLQIVPFTHLHSGIWQFVCSGSTSDRAAWHWILKLRVLPRTPSGDPVEQYPQAEPLNLATPPIFVPQQPDRLDRTPTATLEVAPQQLADLDDDTEDLSPPTEPLVPISLLDEQPNWAEELERLLEQLDRDSSIAPPQPLVGVSVLSPTPSPVVIPALLPAPSPVSTPEPLPGSIQLSAILDPPLQLISLNRSTFSGMIPGHLLTIGGACNLKLLNTKLVQAVKIEKLSICLRHPQTSEIISAIEQPLTSNMDMFAFCGRLELPIEPKITLLLGEVNLYDRHHIQIGSSGFTVTLNLNPLHESELPLFQVFDGRKANTDPTIDARAQRLREKFTKELHLEATTTVRHDSSEQQQQAPRIKFEIGEVTPTLFVGTNEATPTANSAYATTPLTYHQKFTHPDIVPVPPTTSVRPPSPEDTIATTAADCSQSAHLAQSIGIEITGELEIDFSRATIGRLPSAHEQRSDRPRNYANLEIVIDG